VPMPTVELPRPPRRQQRISRVRNTEPSSQFRIPSSGPGDKGCVLLVGTTAAELDKSVARRASVGVGPDVSHDAVMLVRAGDQEWVSG
jgi:hypothetical protein